MLLSRSGEVLSFVLTVNAGDDLSEIEKTYQIEADRSVRHLSSSARQETPFGLGLMPR
jgi:hypothetical protein